MAADWKTTYLPLALIAGMLLPLLADPPWALRLTSVVTPVVVSCRKTSDSPLASPATMLGEYVQNATYRPSLLTTGP